MKTRCAQLLIVGFLSISASTSVVAIAKPAHAETADEKASLGRARAAEKARQGRFMAALRRPDRRLAPTMLDGKVVHAHVEGEQVVYRIASGQDGAGRDVTAAIEKRRAESAPMARVQSTLRKLAATRVGRALTGKAPPQQPQRK